MNGKKTYIGLALHAIWFAIYIYGEITKHFEISGELQAKGHGFIGTLTATGIGHKIIKNRVMIGKKTGIATREEARFLGKLVAKQIPVKGIWRPVVNFALPILLDSMDDKVGDKLPQPWQGYAETMITKMFIILQDGKVTESERQDLINYCAVVLNAKIDIPLIEEDEELVAFLATLKWLAGYIIKAAKNV